MKYLIFCVSASIIIGLASCKPKAHCGEIEFRNVEEYTAFVLKQQDRIKMQMLSLNTEFETGNATQIKQEYSQLILTCDSTLLLINKLSAYDGQEEFRLSAIKLFSFYSEVFHDEYRNLLEFYLKKETPIQPELDSMNALVGRINKAEDSLVNSFKSELEALHAL
ncbi:MAG: hypothetical protein WED33_05825 [Bacteroidia bacterium]